MKLDISEFAHHKLHVFEPSMQIAEATHQFVFGYIRFAHFAAGMILIVGFLGRIYWAFVGNHHAKQLFILPVWNRHCVTTDCRPRPTSPRTTGSWGLRG